MKIKHIIFGFAALLSFLCSFYSAVCLLLFLSSSKEDKNSNKNSTAHLEHDLLEAVYSLIKDYALLALFIIQHSCMASSTYKKFIERINLGVIERSIYNFATSLCILLLINQWKYVNIYKLWDLPTESYPIINSGIFIFHLISWSVIYGGSLLMDTPEIFGIKQVIYDVKGLSCPIAYKSRELRRLYQHMRHPSFIALFVIFWCTPVMSLDRLLLASMWSLYMLLGWRTDSFDVDYQEDQLDRKRHELHRLLQENN